MSSESSVSDDLDIFVIELLVVKEVFGVTEILGLGVASFSGNAA